MTRWYTRNGNHVHDVSWTAQLNQAYVKMCKFTTTALHYCGQNYPIEPTSELGSFALTSTKAITESLITAEPRQIESLITQTTDGYQGSEIESLITQTTDGYQGSDTTSIFLHHFRDSGQRRSLSDCARTPSFSSAQPSSEAPTLSFLNRPNT